MEASSGTRAHVFIPPLLISIPGKCQTALCPTAAGPCSPPPAPQPGTHPQGRPTHRTRSSQGSPTSPGALNQAAEVFKHPLNSLPILKSPLSLVLAFFHELDPKTKLSRAKGGGRRRRNPAQGGEGGGNRNAEGKGKKMGIQQQRTPGNSPSASELLRNPRGTWGFSKEQPPEHRSRYHSAREEVGSLTIWVLEQHPDTQSCQHPLPMEQGFPSGCPGRCCPAPQPRGSLRPATLRGPRNVLYRQREGKG